MIERIEFEDWDGIAAGALYPLSSRTVLVCSDERCRGAILGALGFFRIEEQFASVYERIWRRSRPIGAAIFSSLVSDGRATIRARVDGRELCLKLDVPESCRLRGTIEGEDAPSFEIGVDEREGRVFGLRGLPNGPRTMARTR